MYVTCSDFYLVLVDNRLIPTEEVQEITACVCECVIIMVSIVIAVRPIV